MSIVRIGLAETRNFANGYSAIFGKKATKQEETPAAKTGGKKKKKAKKKK